jgi:hypothetical protein
MSALKLSIEAGPHDRRFVPVCASIKAPSGAVSAVVAPEEAAGMDIPPPPIAGEILKSDDGGSELRFIVPWLPKNSSRIYDVTFADEPAGNGVGLASGDTGNVEVSIQGRTLGVYHADPAWARPFLHPVMGPFGHSVTRGWPQEGRPGEAWDHPHHKSLYVAHGDVNGVDNWSEEGNHGRQVQREVLQCRSGDVSGVLETINDWVGHDGTKVCEDRRKLTFWSLPESLGLFDVEVEFSATEGPLTFGDTKEGGILTARVATTMDVPRTGRIRQAEGGNDEPETWGKRSAWCDYSGLDEGGNQVGIALLNHPMSFRYPTYWHVRNYGLMGANPFGLSDFYGDKSRDGTYSIEAGEKLWFGYRVCVHAGDADGGQVDDVFHGYANPPKATVVD